MPEYELITKLNYTNTADLNRMRDLASKGMNYPETVDDGNGNQVPNPQSKLAFIKTIMRQFLFQQMRRGEMITNAQDAANAHMEAWDTENGPKVIEG